MKKGPLHFLGRKNRSLFDTNVQIKDMDNVELVLDSPAIPESGTASVRARPTVKHHSSSDSFQGFAVPTPKVPLLPPVNGPKANGTVGEDRLSNGSVISVPDLMEGEIFVPPPPSVAPPPPPGTFIPPPPDFMGDLNSLDHYPPKPSAMEEDFAFLQPPPMAPPKPPSACSSGSASSYLSSAPGQIPEPPNFAPAQPPEKQQKPIHKPPPPKPIRMSSISNLDLPPQTPAPPPPQQTPTRSTFNPQNTAKLFTVPQHSILSSYNSRPEHQRPKQMLLLEESGSVKSPPVLAQVDGKVSTPATPVSPPSLPASNKETKKGIDSAQTLGPKPLQTPPRTSPHLLKVNSSHVNAETAKDTLEDSPSQGRRFSPLLERKLRNLKSSEPSGAREGPAASPLALLMAAKEREKHKPTHSLSRENSAKKNEHPGTSVHPIDSGSFAVFPRSSSSSSLSSQGRVEDRLESAVPTVQKTPLFRDQVRTISPAPNRITAAPTAGATDPVGQKHIREQTLPKNGSAQPEINHLELVLPLLPPPPEFDDSEVFVEPPPSIPPPEPPMKKPPPPPVSLPPPAPVLPPASKPAPVLPPASKPAPVLPPASKPAPVLPLASKPVPKVAPKFQPPNTDIKPKPQMVPNKTPSSLSPNQATLLSILQKKMLEMDHKMAPTTEAETGSDDWGTPQSDENKKVAVVPRAPVQSKNNPAANKTASLDMRELENKVAKKYQETSSLKVPSSNGRSKHQYGMTFTVRPGTKHPITPIYK